MREVLFKGKRRDNGKWIEGDLLHDRLWLSKENICRITDVDSQLLYKDDVVIPETIGQYTGINDINTNKIFEHDIIRKIVDDKELIGVVEYSDGAFGVRFADGLGQLLCFFDGCCEVIGNIHDNPELLSK